MLKKRLIFTLLYENGFFNLSRNFRLQRVGNLEWLFKNYAFREVSRALDELVVLNVTRSGHNHADFINVLKKLSAECFIPIAAGGGIRTLDQAKELLRSGADKLVLNTPLFENPLLVQDIVESFGQQCIVGSLDCKRNNLSNFELYTRNGQHATGHSLEEGFRQVELLQVGELYLNSIDRDGTGQGFDLEMVSAVTKTFPLPVILAGGAGNYKHLLEGLQNSEVNAVATAHLFNFIGDGLPTARKRLLESNIQLANFLT
jgi:cyclase